MANISSTRKGKKVSSQYLGRLGLSSALGTELCAGGKLVLAVRTLRLLLRCTALGTKLRAFTKLGTALNARYFRDLHLATAVRTEFCGCVVLFSAGGAWDSGGSATAATRLLTSAKSIRHLVADRKS